MSFSRISLLFVLAEWACIAYGYAEQSTRALYTLFIYGSPITLAMNLFSQGSVLFESHPLFIGLLAFHILKYGAIFMAQIGDEGNWSRLTAILLEIAYLAFSGYLVNPL